MPEFIAWTNQKCLKVKKLVIEIRDISHRNSGLPFLAQNPVVYMDQKQVVHLQKITMVSYVHQVVNCTVLLMRQGWMETQTDTDTHRQRQTETETDRERQRETERDRETDRQTDRQADRQADRQTDRQTDRQIVIFELGTVLVTNTNFTKNKLTSQ